PLPRPFGTTPSFPGASPLDGSQEGRVRKHDRSQLEGCHHVETFAPLAANPALHTLLLGEVGDLSTLAGSETITRLAVLNSTLSDLSVLSTLPALQEVAIGHCSRLSREALSVLTKLPNLRRVYMDYQRVKSLTPTLQASFPGELLSLDYRPPWALDTPKRPSQ
ncbi:MAG: Leucine-rich repeat (LRR) protein, partial [Myxococcota bacterium]